MQKPEREFPADLGHYHASVGRSLGSFHDRDATVEDAGSAHQVAGYLTEEGGRRMTDEQLVQVMALRGGVVGPGGERACSLPSHHGKGQPRHSGDRASARRATGTAVRLRHRQGLLSGDRAALGKDDPLALCGEAWAEQPKGKALRGLCATPRGHDSGRVLGRSQAGNGCIDSGRGKGSDVAQEPRSGRRALRVTTYLFRRQLACGVCVRWSRLHSSRRCDGCREVKDGCLTRSASRSSERPRLRKLN